ncbi:aminotransferase class V-fold PLP-dependent enzyme [Fulvivirgaceae bacterium BMA10]|uniref:phosphoserine transaminase n=1 Tax=Splendidivirga corallicola TaxID=3051826 RepID=A0ABT8KGB9_9BACT|nr:aminotransferase class V-fold PLP-dependent enzyme [Fulvivirgaceae bacterium BMA10]
MKKLFFTPGPSALYFTAEEHIKQALKEQVPSISHRGKDFQKIFASAVENIKVLLNIPDDFHIFFTGSANEIWERLIENCVEHESFHLVNGAFSKRFHQVSHELGRNALALNSPHGTCASIEEILVPETSELIATTQNETSTGVMQPLQDMYTLRSRYPEKLLAVDTVSALPYADIDYTMVDSVYFSVQKGFGLPAGLGVWILNERCIEKANKLRSKGRSTGSYHSISSLLEKAGKNQTPETPNVLGMYLLSKVAADMIEKGITQIRKETEYKAAILYNMLEAHSLLDPFVKEKQHRSKTVIVAETKKTSSEIIGKVAETGMVIGTGYGSFKEDHIRIANFPTHSKEQMEMLVDFLEGLN